MRTLLLVATTLLSLASSGVKAECDKGEWGIWVGLINAKGDTHSVEKCIPDKDRIQTIDINTVVPKDVLVAFPEFRGCVFDDLGSFSILECPEKATELRVFRGNPTRGKYVFFDARKYSHQTPQALMLKRELAERAGDSQTSEECRNLLERIYGLK